MLDKRQHLRVFLFLLALLAAPASIHARTANMLLAATDLPLPPKLRDDFIRAKRAVEALEQLKADVLVYRSCGEFESDGRLDRVPLETFTHKLNRATAEVESILSQLSDAKLRSHLSNSLYSYRDGAFWWAKLDQEKVVKIADLRVGFTTTTPAGRFFQSTAPYTVVVHWRQANRYLLRAQRLVVEPKTTATQQSR
jgi:hypothetical protein